MTISSSEVQGFKEVLQVNPASQISGVNAGLPALRSAPPARSGSVTTLHLHVCLGLLLSTVLTLSLSRSLCRLNLVNLYFICDFSFFSL